MKEGWRTFADFLKDYFPCKMQKLAINAGFSCPNRDGTLGTGGCTYCNNVAFTPGYCDASIGVKEQLERGKEFFSRKYPLMRYLAYFQAYTSTHEASVPRLMELYRQAVEVPGVDGVIIATRPDCVSHELLHRVKTELPWAMMEYGAETSHDVTLNIVNRGHSWVDVCNAVEQTAAVGLPVGLHLIMGLPGEDETMMMQTIERVNCLPVNVVKIHRLQVLRGTPLFHQWQQGKVSLMQGSAQDYARLCARMVNALRPDIAIDRFVSSSPPSLVAFPSWGLKNHEFTALVIRSLEH